MGFTDLCFNPCRWILCHFV